MRRSSYGLAIALVIAVAGCQESTPGGSAPAGAGGSGTSTSTPSTTTTTSSETGMSAGAKTEAAAPAAQEVTMPSGLKYQDLVVGTGAEATPGKRVAVHYTGWLTNGTKFDSSVDRGQPYVFPLGGGEVIRGWDEGIVGMKVGGKRKLTIPPDLAYGAAGRQPVIPPNSTLMFDVELVSVN